MTPYLVDDCIAYRVFEGQCHPIPTTDAAGEQLVPREEVLISPGEYCFRGRNYDLSTPGVYRFQPPGEIGRQFAVLPDTVLGIASIVSELAVLGNSDRNKPWALQSRIATRRRLLLHCVQVSNLSVYLASKVGLAGRTWLMWSYEAREAGDPLASHAISELTDKARSEVRLFDLSFGVEIVVKPGRTDFASFQSALLGDHDIRYQPVSHAFGFEYGVRFFNPHSEDFDNDLLASSFQALREAHRRIAGGGYVIGLDAEGQKFVTEATRRIVAALPEEAVPSDKRAEMAAATLVPSDLNTSSAQPLDNTYRRDGIVGYRIDALGVEPIPSGSQGDPVQLSDRDEAGLRLSSGAVWQVGDASLDLRAEGIYRFRRTFSGPALQGIVARSDAYRFAVHLLEATAHGTMHDDMVADDLRLAARSAKAIAQGESIHRLIQSVFALVRIPYRLWSVPTVLADTEDDWPIPVRLTALELADETGARRLLDPDRALVLVGGGSFSDMEAAQGRFEWERACATPRFSFGGTDAKTGLSTDLMAPIWLGDKGFANTLWQESLSVFPALAVDASGRKLTTTASQEKARHLLKKGGETLRPYLVDVLDATTV